MTWVVVAVEVVKEAVVVEVELLLLSVSEVLELDVLLSVVLDDSLEVVVVTGGTVLVLLEALEVWVAV